MGDRVLVQLKNSEEVSPVLYGHWAGRDAEGWLDELKQRMGDRITDLSYSFARLVQIATKTDPDGILSYGVWNSEKELDSAASHGDAGCYVLNVDTGEITHHE